MSERSSGGRAAMQMLSSRARIAACRAIRRTSDSGLAWLFVASLALSSVALINGYPLVFPDTGSYINNAVNRDLGALDRPPYYSLFLLPLHLKMTLWSIPFAQNLIVCWVLFRFLAWIFPNLSVRLRCAVIVLTGVVSYLPWASNEIMPDIYTPLILLLIFMLILPIGHKLTLPTDYKARLERLVMLLLLTLSITFHQANGPFAAGLMALAAFLNLMRGRSVRLMARTTLPVCVCILLAVGAQALWGYVVFGRVTPSPAGSVFLLSRVIYDGPGRAYLAKICPTKHYPLCDHQSELIGTQNDNFFLWDPQSSLRYLGGGWTPIRASPSFQRAGSPSLQRAQRAVGEAAAIVSGTLRVYPFHELLAAAKNTGRQLVDFGPADLGPTADVPWIVHVINDLFPREYDQFANSLQNRAWWRSSKLSILQIAVVIMSLTTLSIMVYRSWFRPSVSSFVLYLFWGLVLNAALMGALSGPFNRYQARLIWLIPFITISLVVDRLTSPARARPEEPTKLPRRHVMALPEPGHPRPARVWGSRESSFQSAGIRSRRVET